MDENRASRMTLRAYDRTPDGVEIARGDPQSVTRYRDILAATPLSPAVWPPCRCPLCAPVG
ncbi:hypothetical protein [Yinghuangia seranimata]|uniref:hypothetical protein n=1 Tax=Yinghuangia seranimata TaxID=408067 RepID=UPI00248C683D|nr:hypothetical protein [Yinghuangia seranimata]MDI2126571.1 hypothetical protein [Yinghuangia seranimata]